MKVATVKKQPNEKRRWAIDYTDALDPGDEIISVSHVVEPNDLTVTYIFSEDDIAVTCAGGADGTTYKVTLTVTTTATNEIIEDELYVKVKEI